MGAQCFFGYRESKYIASLTPEEFSRRLLLSNIRENNYNGNDTGESCARSRTFSHCSNAPNNASQCRLNRSTMVPCSGSSRSGFHLHTAQILLRSSEWMMSTRTAPYRMVKVRRRCGNEHISRTSLNEQRQARRVSATPRWGCPRDARNRSASFFGSLSLEGG